MSDRQNFNILIPFPLSKVAILTCNNLLIGVSIIITSAISFELNAKEFSANASNTITYSDNINLNSTNQSRVVDTLSLGATLKLEEEKSDLLLKYDVYRVMHFNNSESSRTFNQLEFKANRKDGNDGIKLNASAGIRNISRSIRDANQPDIISGNTIETRTARTSVTYANSSKKLVDFTGFLEGDLQSNEDNIGNRRGLIGNISLSNGTNLTNYTWSTNYSYKRTFYNSEFDDAFTHEFEQRLGFYPIDKLNAFVRFNYENVSRDDIDSRNEYYSWGPAVKYFLKNNSYVELRYEIPSGNDNFFSGSFNFNPTSRTNLSFDYTRRFFGDSFYFAFEHHLKRLTNIIEYKDEVRDFERELFVDGELVDGYQIVRGLTYKGNLALKKSTLDFNLYSLERKPVTVVDLEKLKSLNADLGLNYNLTKRLTLSSSFQFNNNVFNYLNREQEKILTRTYKFSLNNQFSRNLDGFFSYSHINSSRYSENKFSVNFNVRL